MWSSSEFSALAWLRQLREAGKSLVGRVVPPTPKGRGGGRLERCGTFGGERHHGFPVASSQGQSTALGMPGCWPRQGRLLFVTNVDSDLGSSLMA